MADESLFPEAAIAILRRTQWNPRAACAYEGMSGGLVWGDEFPLDAISACVSVDNWAFRYVLGYRASLIRGTPREELRPPWDQLAQQCPQWPGFRPERRSSELRKLLEAENTRFLADVEILFDEPKDV
jgi:hypothetical protein